MIKLACHSRNYGIDTPQNTLSFIHSLGYEYVDIDATLIPTADAVNSPKKTEDMLCRLLGEYYLIPEEYIGAELVADGNSYSPTELPDSKKEAAFRYFDATCSFAASVGFKSIMCGAGFPIAGHSYEASFERAAVVFEKMVEIAGDHGIVFNVEPSRSSILNSPEKALNMIARVPRLGYTLDLLHYITLGYSTENALALLPYTNHIHSRQAANGWGKCAVEFGEIDYDLLLKRLRGMNWSGSIADEFWVTPEETAQGLDAVEQTILMRYQIRSYIRKYWQ